MESHGLVPRAPWQAAIRCNNVPVANSLIAGRLGLYPVFPVPQPVASKNHQVTSSVPTSGFPHDPNVIMRSGPRKCDTTLYDSTCVFAQVGTLFPNKGQKKTRHFGVPNFETCLFSHPTAPGFPHIKRQSRRSLGSGMGHTTANGVACDQSVAGGGGKERTGDRCFSLSGCLKVLYLNKWLVSFWFPFKRPLQKGRPQKDPYSGACGTQNCPLLRICFDIILSLPEFLEFRVFGKTMLVANQMFGLYVANPLRKRVPQKGTVFEPTVVPAFPFLEGFLSNPARSCRKNIVLFSHPTGLGLFRFPPFLAQQLIT